MFEKELSIAKDIARKAGAIILQYFDEGQDVEHKADNSPVTIADKKINRMAIEELEQSFDDGIVGEEESTAEYGMGRRWLCDPIDGTKPYTYGAPLAMFSLGLVIDGKPVLGVVYDPFLDRLYEAVVGQGAFCNEKPVHVSFDKLPGSFVAITSSVDRIFAERAYIDELTRQTARIASVSGGVYKMCLLARGKVAAYADSRINAHDIAGCHVIIEEAGGKVTDLDGGQLDYSRPFQGAVMSNTVTHEDIQKAFALRNG